MTKIKKPLSKFPSLNVLLKFPDKKIKLEGWALRIFSRYISVEIPKSRNHYMEYHHMIRVFKEVRGRGKNAKVVKQIHEDHSGHQELEKLGLIKIEGMGSFGWITWELTPFGEEVLLVLQKAKVVKPIKMKLLKRNQSNKD
ncbi:MAG: hypothetical protein KBC98_02200 [Candidatus Pacebacteria bacterium]|nr:hypothetical protein [Candidatus Paceibacterota bacterium]